MTSSVEVAGVQGLEPALAPGAASPAFNLLVRVHNNDFHDQCRAGGDVVVSYAGVPLAHGRTPSFFLWAKKAVTMAVNATSEGVGVPDDLFRLMSAERRQGVAQLDIGMQLGSTDWDRESYTWSVDLDE